LKEHEMSDTQTSGGFTGDPVAALAVTGSSGCCGNPTPAATSVAPGPAAATADPCCGTQAEAQAADSCCGAGAKADAVASGTGCCG
jgi:hypothetical protein